MLPRKLKCYERIGAIGGLKMSFDPELNIDDTDKIMLERIAKQNKAKLERLLAFERHINGR